MEQMEHAVRESKRIHQLQVGFFFDLDVAQVSYVYLFVC